MTFRNIFFVLFSMILISIAGPAQAQQTQDTGNGMSSDTMQTEGMIESVSLQDSMIVLTTDKGMDTVYYNSQTEFTVGDPMKVLRPNTKIRISYTTEGDRKIATRVQPAATNGNGSKKDTAKQDTGDMAPPAPGNE